LEPGINAAKRSGVEPVKAVAAAAVLADKAGAAEQAEMLGDGGAGDRESTSDLSGGLVALAKEIEDRPAGGVGQGAEDGVAGMRNGTASHDV
jgi:hypothetical protein